jgi:hypothetical protein
VAHQFARGSALSRAASTAAMLAVSLKAFQAAM